MTMTVVAETARSGIQRALACDMTAGETLLLQTRHAAIGTFRARPSDPWFAGSGPLQLHYVAFPLGRAVEIRHRERAPFLASPATLSLLAPGDSYTRRLVAPEGDRVIYLALSGLAMQRAVAQVAPALLDLQHGLGALSGPAPVAPQAFLQARLLACDLASQRLATTLEAEERAFLLLQQVLAGACAQRARHPRQRPGSAAAQLRRVERAKAYLALHHDASISLARLGEVAATAPCHLARLFRLHTGFSVHQYLTRLRLASALDLLLQCPGQLSSVALQLGFTHHSHFSARFLQAFGLTPSAYQRRASAASARPLRRALAAGI